ncbi:uncharacterized protein strc1 [Gouania willdenowi]|uniref:Uncharacterized LOC114457541 n=1 Tax=Gouania willdenowi TaxID=441366 RepID=A0A8C5GQI9_GOUWI|nr:uncharacterized protein LOC114457541 [Gouania willdenowi]
MWSTPAVYTLCILTGIICDVNLVMSQPRLIQKKTEESPSESLKIQEEIQEVINQIHSLSEDHKRGFSLPPTAGNIDLNAYYAVLNNLYNLLQSLLEDKFMDELPKMLVCILSERQDCGLQAELTKTVSLELGKPLLLYASSLKSQMCSSLSSDEDSPSFLRAYLRMGESASAAMGTFQQMILNILPSLSLSENVLNIVSSFTDATVLYILRFMAVLLDGPVDYIRIALQFGIEVPHLDENGFCAKGDLKHLIMWGMKHNLSWSFGVPLLDVLLQVTLPQEDSPYVHEESECLNHASVPLQRSNTQTGEDTGFSPEALCEHYKLAKFNDTLCADILSGSTVGSSTSVINFCQGLSSLSPNQIQKVWSNMCNFVQQLVLPLVSRSSDCSILNEGSYPTSTFAFEPPSQAEALHRAARDASNLQQPACDYNSWLEDDRVDAALVYGCSDKEQDEFVRRVCHNDLLLKKLLLDNMNSWLYEFCYNSSVDPSPLVSFFCTYEQWMDQIGAPVDSSQVEFCMKVDTLKLTNLFCQHTGVFMLLASNPDNWRFLPNCTNNTTPAPFPGQDLLQLESCQYSEWTEVMQITTDQLSKCILHDQSAFNREVCTNNTFLNGLLRNPDLRWLESHCTTNFNIQNNEPPAPAPTPSLNITNWCEYHRWGEVQVDISVVGLCWQKDQLAFQENVCCKASVLDKLLQNPQNKWLTSVCTDIKEVTMLPQVCKYSEWGLPIIVDMTDIALCAEKDPHNFTSKVCANKTVLQNLLANQDNTWLIEHCANHTSGISPGGGLTGFIAAEHCQYNSWKISPPDIELLYLCWERDQTNFVTSVCPNDSLLSSLSLEPYSMWVSSICTTYTNYTTTTHPNNQTTTKPSICPIQKLIQQFNWNCSTHFTSACQPCTTQNMVLQTLVRCWVHSLRARLVNVLPQSVTTVFEKAVSTTMVILLALEDVQISSWHVTDTIRQSVLKSVVDFFKTTSDANKKSVLLQCFGTALTNLLQSSRDMSSDELAVIQEYFNLPLSSLKPVLLTAHIRTVRLILQYYSSKKGTLHLSNEYLSTMVSVLLQNHLVKDHQLFLELAPLLNSSSPADVHNLPQLQNQPSVLQAINTNLESMSLDLRRAYGLWYSKTMSPSNIIGGHDSLIRDTGNLIAYLPFQHFQHFSAAQLLDGLEVLKRNNLSSLKQEFIARTLIGADRNLTAEDFARLGNITCLADPEDLLAYRSTEAFGVIQGSIMNCTRQGIDLPSQLVSTLLLNSMDLQNPSSLSAHRLAELVPLLPSLGVTFLQKLTVSQLRNLLPNISSTNFSPGQSRVIVDKLSSSNTLTSNMLLELGSLLRGVSTESLLALTSDRLRSSLTAVNQNTDLCNPKTKGFSPPQANAIATKLWGFPAVVDWLNDVEPLLSCTPLLSVKSRTNVLVREGFNLSINSWTTQQAKAIFNEMHENNPTLMKKHFLSLGTLGQGVSCRVLQEILRASPSPSSVRSILTVLRQQPRPLHTSLKKCLIEELYKFEFFSELLEDLGAEIALSMPISMIKKFPMMDILRRMIVEDPRFFLLMPRTKQELLVDKIVQRMGMYVGVFTEEEFRSLGVMASFVGDEVFIQVDRSFFIGNLDFLSDLCYSSTKMEVMARILQEEAVFGSVKTWNQSTLSQMNRLLFFLPKSELQRISPALMTVGRIEKVFMSQRQWELTDVGTHCLDQRERQALFEKQQFVLQFFLGFLKIFPLSAPPIIPTCEILHTTAPSAWTSSSLYSMATSAFYNCLELMGNDPFLETYQRVEVLRKLKEIHGPVSSFPDSVISQLGRIATELTPEELRSLSLTGRRSIAALGAVSSWNSRQLAALFASVLKSTGQSPSQLDSSTLVSLGYIVCGANTTQIKAFNPIELSKAVLWLGQLKLSCSHDQLVALVELLAHAFAFQSMSSWGTDVFIEIGVLAAGLPDMAMSALVKEQIEGIPPAAISVISPAKFSVVFDQQKISMFSYEQAAAVTDEQFAALTDVEKTALAMVLTPWEDKNVNFRGRSHGLTLTPSPLSLLLGPVIPLIFLFCSDT